ncbi:hypothetical protein B0H11DRAFT_440168 [Mycena galericulata]|nr:hypothetical protein B0H11DRAFT_440168 [Mycena galericulata]
MSSIPPNQLNSLSRVFRPYATPKVDRKRLAVKFLNSIVAVMPQPVSTFHVLSFIEPEAPLGSVVVMNPTSTSYFSLGIASSPAEWRCTLPRLTLPRLSFLSIDSDLEWNSLAVFLEKHQKIECLVFKSDWSCFEPKELGHFSISALPHLNHLSAGPRVVSRLLQMHKLPLLGRVSIKADLDSSRYFPDALKAVASHPSVTCLKFDLYSVSTPWINFDEDKSEVEPGLNHVQKMDISGWPPRADHRAFPSWLAMFPGIQELCISGSVAEGQQLLSDWLLDTIKATSPHIWRISQMPLVKRLRK